MTFIRAGEGGVEISDDPSDSVRIWLEIRHSTIGDGGGTENVEWLSGVTADQAEAIAQALLDAAKRKRLVDMSQPTDRDQTILRMARAIAETDPDQEGQINASDMGEYFWEKYRSRYITMATAAFDALPAQPQP